MDDDEVWSFAFGSNLHPEVRERRCGLHPSLMVPAQLPGWRLVFDLPGVPWVEPAMASIVPAPGHAVHGLLLRLRPEQLVALDRSEGGGRFYRQVEVEAHRYTGERVRALAFKTAPGSVARERLPSLRYLQLIREGARHSGLDPDYCRWLDELPHARATALEQRIGGLAVDGLSWMGRTRLRDLGFGYLALLHRLEARGGALSSVSGQGLLLAPLVAIGLGARARARIVGR